MYLLVKYIHLYCKYTFRNINFHHILHLLGLLQLCSVYHPLVRPRSVANAGEGTLIDYLNAQVYRLKSVLFV